MAKKSHLLKIGPTQQERGAQNAIQNSGNRNENPQPAVSENHSAQEKLSPPRRRKASFFGFRKRCLRNSPSHSNIIFSACDNECGLKLWVTYRDPASASVFWFEGKSLDQNPWSTPTYAGVLVHETAQGQDQQHEPIYNNDNENDNGKVTQPQAERPKTKKKPSTLGVCPSRPKLWIHPTHTHTRAHTHTQRDTQIPKKTWLIKPGCVYTLHVCAPTSKQFFNLDQHVAFTLQNPLKRKKVVLARLILCCVFPKVSPNWVKVNYEVRYTHHISQFDTPDRNRQGINGNLPNCNAVDTGLRPKKNMYENLNILPPKQGGLSASMSRSHA